MTKTELKTKWQELLSKLEENGMQQVVIQTYFEDLVPVKLSEKDNILYLNCPLNREFIQSQIRRHQDEFVAASEAVFGKPYTAEITEDSAEDSDAEGIVADPLDPSFTFDSFVQGPNNRLAYVVSQAVADGFSKKYNPLFIYAESGLGKTHLMHAIGHYVLVNKPKKKVLYVSCETFISELIDAIRTSKQKSFKDKYQKVDYLLFDDIQFITQSDAAQNELFQTFEALYNAGKQLVFTSDRPPKELRGLPERLTSRFVWGMAVDIQQPEYETRMAILQNKAALDGLDIKDEKLNEVFTLIAQSINSNIRELEGAYRTILSYSTLLDEPITVSLAKKVLSKTFNTQEVEITPEGIKKFVANYYGIKVSDLESPVRSRNINYPRQIAIYLIRNNTNLSYPQIGALFGGRDHTSIMNAYKNISDEVKYNKESAANIDAIMRKMKE